MNLTDAEQTFADSLDGQRFLAREAMIFRTRHAYLGDRAPQWGDAEQRAAIRQGSAEHARESVQRSALAAAAPAQIADATVARDAARVAYIDHLNNGWKS